MSDNLSPENRQKTMRAVKSKGTRLERQLWAMLAGMDIGGWKKNADTITGKPDIAFIDWRIAVFIDGCFWHGCPHCQRPLPKTNHEYWEKKIKRNVELAQQHNAQLRQDGWTVIRIWEHEMADITSVRAKIRHALEEKEQ